MEMVLLGVDDQIFKRDGTILTDIDIYLLKFSRLLADLLFAKSEDEDYSPALSRMTKSVSVLFAASFVPLVVSGNWLQAVCAIIVSGLIIIGKVYTLECTGRGTLCDNYEKVFPLVALAIAAIIPILGLVISLISGDISSPRLVGKLSFILGIILYYLAQHYVIRLGKRPPRKRVRALKPVLNGI